MRWWVMVVAALALAGCEETAERCGAGTVELDGVCMPAEPASPVCGFGTELGPEGDTCFAIVPIIDCFGGVECTDAEGRPYCSCTLTCEAP